MANKKRGSQEPKRPKTPLCDLWASTIMEQMLLLEEFAEWYHNDVLSSLPENTGFIDWPPPDKRMFDRFLEDLHADKDFTFAKLDDERRALLEYARELNESRT